MKNLTLTCLILATSSSVASAADNDFLRTVLLTGDAIQGVAGPGRVAKYLYPTRPPIITSDGSVSGLSYLEATGFSGWTSWVENSGIPTAVLSLPSSIVVEGAPYQVIGFAGDATFNTAKVGAFKLRTGTPQGSEKHFVATIDASGTTTILAEEGTRAHGVAGETYFGSFKDDIQAAISESGSVAFKSPVSVNGSTSEGMWAYRNGNMELIATTSPVVNGSSGEGKLNSLGRPLINSHGQVAFIGTATRSYRPISVILSEGGGGLQTLAESGGAAPGMPEGVVFDPDSRFDFYYPSFNSKGQAAFVARLDGPGVIRNSGGIWRGVTAGDLEPVILSGDVLPSFPPGHKATGFSQLLMNESGELAFWMATALGGLGPDGFPASNNVSRGVYAGSQRGDIRLVAGTGPGPGLAPGEKMYPLDANPNQQPGLAINGRGAVAFSGRILGEVERFDNNIAIWAEDVSGKLRLIVRTGQMIDVDDGPEVDLRTVSRVDFLANRPAGYNPHDGFNDSGLLAFSAEFTDGSAGVFVSSLAAVPEPGGAALVAVAAMLVGAARKPRADFSPRRAQRSRRSIVATVLAIKPWRANRRVRTPALQATSWSAVRGRCGVPLSADLGSAAKRGDFARVGDPCYGSWSGSLPTTRATAKPS